ncbi:LON peptidase substrate-binding domain-containing protein [Marinicauda sp. Alg238-R41]|uniref:LON peptidase substrate-binding domain-containing protein n=1 Tax=Marinicauda sp. Alg238-R41 TaxID=2993447 RepID=UPI0022E5663D|nr:LON peptidase substrate-binding domain-containing protein [Marinicauda sp. Alg238-R41]
MTHGIQPPAQIPLFPIRGCILLPGEHLPLNVFEPRYLNMVDDAMAGDRYLGIVQPSNSGPREKPELCSIGCAGVIASRNETEDGRYLIVLQGVIRFDISAEAEPLTPYRVAHANYARFGGDLTPQALSPEVDRESFLSLLARFFDHMGLDADWESLAQAPVSTIADKVAMAAPFDADAKQALLEAVDPPARIATLASMMSLTLDASGDPPR